MHRPGGGGWIAQERGPVARGGAVATRPEPGTCAKSRPAQSHNIPSLGSSSSISIAHSVLRSAGPHQKKKTIQLNPPTAACKIRAAGSVWVGAGGAVSPVRCGVSALRSPGDRRRETGGGGGGSAALVLGGSWRSGFLLLLPCPDPLLPPSPSSFSRRHKNRVAERESWRKRVWSRAGPCRAGPEGVWAGLGWVGLGGRALPQTNDTAPHGQARLRHSLSLSLSHSLRAPTLGGSSSSGSLLPSFTDINSTAPPSNLNFPGFIKRKKIAKL